jgi:hypothetical protein
MTDKIDIAATNFNRVLTPSLCHQLNIERSFVILLVFAVHLLQKHQMICKGSAGVSALELFALVDRAELPCLDGCVKLDFVWSLINPDFF